MWSWMMWARVAGADELEGWQEACEAASGDRSAQVSLDRAEAGWRVSCGPSTVTVQSLPADHRARVELLWLTLAQQRPATPLLGPPPTPPPVAPPAPIPLPAAPPRALPAAQPPAEPLAVEGAELDAPLPVAPPPDTPPPAATLPRAAADGSAAPDDGGAEERAVRPPSGRRTDDTLELGVGPGSEKAGLRAVLAASVRKDWMVFRVVGQTRAGLGAIYEDWLSLGVESGASVGVGPVRAQGLFGMALRHAVGSRPAPAGFHSVPGVAGQLSVDAGPVPVSVGMRVSYDLARTRYPEYQETADGHTVIHQVHSEPLSVMGTIASRFGRQR